MLDNRKKKSMVAITVLSNPLWGCYKDATGQQIAMMGFRVV